MSWWDSLMSVSSSMQKHLNDPNTWSDLIPGSKAARKQLEQVGAATNLQRDIWNQQREWQQPYMQTGQQALGQMWGDLGSGRYNTDYQPYQGQTWGQSGYNPGNASQGQYGPGGAAQGVGYSPWQQTKWGMPEAPAVAPFDVQADPGFQFRLQQGTEALENSAAARGGLLSGDTGKALQGYAQGLASDETQNAYNRYSNQRDFGQGAYQFGAGLGAQQSNYANTLGRNAYESDRGYDYQNYWDPYRQNRANYETDRNFGYGVYGDQQNQDYRQWQDDYNIRNQQNADQWNRYSGIAGTGQTAVNQMGQTGQGYANAMTNLYGQRGNAMAAQANAPWNMFQWGVQQGTQALPYFM